MGKAIKKLKPMHEEISLGVLIHQHVRAAVEQAVQEELAAVLGVELYERSEARRGERNGSKARTLTGPTGPLELTLPRARLFRPGGSEEWASKLVPRYQRRVREVNESVLAAYLSGANTRRIAGALRPLLKAAPLSKSAVSRVVGTLKSDMEAWEKRSLADLEVAFLYLDAIALRVRMDRRVTSVPVLVALAVLADGQKQLVALEMRGSESHEAWKGFLDGLVERGLRAPLLCIVDGNAGLRRALSTVWSKTPVQRCAVHKLRNLERKAPKHAVAEVKADFHGIVYAASEAAARKAYADFVSKWKSRCPGVVKSLEEAGDELLTMYRFPTSQRSSPFRPEESALLAPAETFLLSSAKPRARAIRRKVASPQRFEMVRAQTHFLDDSAPFSPEALSFPAVEALLASPPQSRPQMQSAPKNDPMKASGIHRAGVPRAENGPTASGGSRCAATPSTSPCTAMPSSARARSCWVVCGRARSSRIRPSSTRRPRRIRSSMPGRLFRTACTGRRDAVVFMVRSDQKRESRTASSAPIVATSPSHTNA